MSPSDVLAVLLVQVDAQNPIMVSALRRAAAVFSRESAATIRRRHPHHLRLQQQPWQAPAIGSLYSSSLAEPALFTAISTEAIAATAADVVVSGGGVENDHLLWSDVRTMGAILGEFISVQDSDEVLVKVETMRKMARESRSSSSSLSLSGGDDII